MTEPLPWRSERPLDARTVERLVDAQFPRLAPARAAFLDEGWDSEVYLVNEEWILRFPKRAEVLRSQGVERALLPRLARILPVPIPEPSLLGESCAEFPFPFLGYRRLPGVPAHAVAPERVDEAGCARRVAALLSRLHAFPVAEAREAGAPTLPPRDPAVLFAKYAGLWAESSHVAPAALAARTAAFLAGPAPERDEIPLVAVHADVTYDHLLLSPDGSDVTGLIDWGDLSVGDPAWDFSGLLAWFGEGFLSHVFDAYEGSVDARLVARTRRSAAFAAISSVWWGVRGARPRDVAAGLRGLDLSLPS